MTDGRVGRVEGEKSLILIESAREQVYAPHLRSEQSDAKTIREAKAQSLNEGGPGKGEERRRERPAPRERNDNSSLRRSANESQRKDEPKEANKRAESVTGPARSAQSGQFPAEERSEIFANKKRRTRGRPDM